MRKITQALRTILLNCSLQEEKKWGKPCFTYEGKNIAVIQDFKSYFALLFFQGGLMKDPKKLLLKMGENTNAGRQMRFESVEEIEKKAPVIKSYIKEAIKLKESGAKIEPKKTEIKDAPEFQKRLKGDAKLKKAFEALTPGRQREYLFFFSGAKKEETREERITKSLPKILKGKGLREL